MKAMTFVQTGLSALLELYIVSRKNNIFSQIFSFHLFNLCIAKETVFLYSIYVSYVFLILKPVLESALRLSLMKALYKCFIIIKWVPTLEKA